MVAGGGVAQNQGWVWQNKKVGEGDAVAVGEEEDQIMALLDGTVDSLCGHWDGAVLVPSGRVIRGLVRVADSGGG